MGSGVTGVRTCDCCRVKPATRLLVRAELGGADDRMLACADCKPPEGEWTSMGMDAEAVAKDAAKEKTT